MEPLLIMALLALLVPVIGAVLIGLPVYAGMYIALYRLYQPAQDWVPHPLAGRFWDMRILAGHYLKLVEQGGLNLPLIWPPLTGIAVAALLLYVFARYVRSQFTVDNL